MIIGTGLLARSFMPHFAHDPDVIIFASGVSNSLETREQMFLRERNLLGTTLESHPGRLVYFGSCAVGAAEVGADTPYLIHKRDQERIVLASNRGLVLRLPQVIGPNPNPNTLGSFLYSNIMSGKHFTVWRNAERNLIDIGDVAPIATALIGRGAVGRAISIAAPRSIAMPELVSIFERVIGKTANVSIEDRGTAMTIDSHEAAAVAATLQIDLGGDYPERVIRKYYGQQTQA
jgi:nucleoside-diphosphate-sugar epimerase